MTVQYLQCDVVLDAAHRKSPEPSAGPRKEDIVESIIFKSSDVVVVHFKDVDLNFAKKGETTPSQTVLFSSPVRTHHVVYIHSYPF